MLYLLLAYAALPVQGAVMKPAGKARGWCCAAAALCCLLAVAGCLLWTPTHYDTLYGLQGRYFLPRAAAASADLPAPPSGRRA